MVKNILLFGAGKSATVLIDYLLAEARDNNWNIIIADANQEQILSKTMNSPLAEAVQTDITDDFQRSNLVKRAAIVISMMPPPLHILVAKDCITYGKNLLTASYLDPSIKSLQKDVENKKLLFLGEMGLDPGIDHMSAMKIINEIKDKGGVVTSFRSHCGGLVAPESDDNPWHYKISWNPRNIVMAGKTGAAFKLDGTIRQKDYNELFVNCPLIQIDGLGALSMYPNRDSISYMPMYALNNIPTFLRTTLRYPSFCIGWDAIVQAGLTDDAVKIISNGLTFAEWSKALIPFINDDNKNLLRFLGVFDKALVPTAATTSADILQYLVETKLMMQTGDKDMIVMKHEIAFEKSGLTTQVESSLIVKGEDHLRTAMAKTVGLPLGIATKLILNGIIQTTGIHIPTIKEIYEPVLLELEKEGICFIEKIK